MEYLTAAKRCTTAAKRCSGEVKKNTQLFPLPADKGYVEAEYMINYDIPGATDVILSAAKNPTTTLPIAGPLADVPDDLSAELPEDPPYQVIDAPPSGLFVKPKPGTDYAEIARSVLARERHFSNSRFVINAQPERVTPLSQSAIALLGAIATESGTTIGLRIAVDPFAYEFEPDTPELHERMQRGALLAMGGGKRLPLDDAPESIRKRIAHYREDFDRRGVIPLIEGMYRFHGISGPTAEERAYLLEKLGSVFETGFPFGHEAVFGRGTNVWQLFYCKRSGKRIWRGEWMTW